MRISKEKKKDFTTYLLIIKLKSPKTTVNYVENKVISTSKINVNKKENCKKKDKVENNPIKYSLIVYLM